MPKKKKGPFGKKGGQPRKGPGTFAPAPSTNNAQRKPPNHAGAGQRQVYGRPANIDPDTPSHEQSSMMQQAANTRKNTSHWDQGTRLRDRPIVFISCGFIEPAKEIQRSNEPTRDTAVKSEGQPDSATVPTPKSDSISQPAATSLTASKDLAQTQTQASTSMQLCDVQDDHDDGAGSDSSEEIILFKGRGTVCKTQSTATHPVLNVVSVPLEQPLPDAPAESMPGPDVQVRERTPEPLAEASPDAATSRPPTSAPMLSLSGPAAPDSNRLSLLVVDSDAEDGSDAAINDYIENMGADDLSDMVRYLGGNRRTLGGSHNDIMIEETESSDAGEEDGGEESEKAFIRWDAEENGIDGEGIGSDSDQLGDDWPLAEDLDDEQLARLLAKQEELGLGSEELILLDDVAAGPAKKGKGSRDASKKHRKSPKSSAPWKEFMAGGLRGSDGAYLTAEAVADAFDQLGLVGRQDDFDFELTDSDLEATLKASWQKDRARKKEKKKARESLRAQGLLGKHADPTDPRIKYANGMEFEDVKEEFRLFLLGSESSVALPPMDAHARKIIHELAYRFNIASKSIGAGDQRRPSLVRKKGTLRFDESQFNAVFAKYRRRFFPRLDSKRGKGGGPPRAAGGRGAGEAAVVRNGEVVGGSAPEIGQANKGRAMLEKMGWSMGMALGAMDNKGMTQPIEHIVKRSKAGLG